MFWLKLATMQRTIILPQFLTSCRQIRQIHKIIAKDVYRPGEF